MSEIRWTRLLPLAGVGAVVLWVVGVLTIDSMRPEAATPTANEILAYYQDESALGLAIFAFMLGSLLFLVFVVALWNRLHEVHGSLGGLTPIVLAAGVVTAIGQLVMYGTDLEAHLDADVISASTAEAYYYLGDYWFTGSMLTAALFVAATGLVVLRGRVIPRWLGWVSLVIAVPLLLPPVGWIVMFLAFPIWVVVVALLLTRSGGRVDEATTADVPWEEMAATGR